MEKEKENSVEVEDAMVVDDEEEEEEDSEEEQEENKETAVKLFVPFFFRSLLYRS